MCQALGLRGKKKKKNLNKVNLYPGGSSHLSGEDRWSKDSSLCRRGSVEPEFKVWALWKMGIKVEPLH